MNGWGALIPLLLVTVAGAATAVQSPTNAMLARAVGSSVNASFVSFLVGTIALAVLVLIGQARPDWAATRALPWYAWIGGLYGVCFVVAATWGVPRLGVALTITLMVAGQLLISVVLDHYGAFGAPRQPINVGKITGVALVIAGVLLVRRS